MANSNLQQALELILIWNFRKFVAILLHCIPELCAHHDQAQIWQLSSAFKQPVHNNFQRPKSECCIWYVVVPALRNALALLMKRAVVIQEILFLRLS